jgi:hypothetical protein
MGKQNRQRRAQKRRTRAPRSGGTRPGSYGFGGSPSAGAGGAPSAEERVAEALNAAAVAATRGGRRGELDLHIDHLESAGRPLGPGAVPRIVLSGLLEQTHEMWHNGWQPADVLCALSRRAPQSVGLASVVIIAEAERTKPGTAVPPRWARQLEVIQAEQVAPLVAERRSRPTDWLGGDGQSAEARRSALRTAMLLLGTLLFLPPLPPLMPDPCSWPQRDRPDGAGRPRRGRPSAAGLDPGLLDKVRALLAKAESTTFEAEAMAFTAKAQELMTRHAIDRAVLEQDDDGSGDGEQPEGLRLPVDDPYAGERASLLAVVADANRSRAVWAKELGFSTVFGFASDLDAVELLYTSLLVQATSAMVAEGPRRDHTGRSRTRSFRQSFLAGFVNRIGQRLREASAASVAEAQAAEAARGGTMALVPLLEARERRVDDVRDRAFPHLREHAMRATNWEGWEAGQVAAQQASLAAGEPLKR